MGVKAWIQGGDAGPAPRWGKWLGGAAVLAVVAAAVGLRLSIARTALFPGHSDYAFYYTVARNIAEGRWLQIDYIWHYLNGLPAITHYSNDFWMPLTSILQSLGMLAFGKSMFGALVPSVMAGTAISLPAFFLAKTYSAERLVPWTAAGLVLFLPVLFRYSLLSDSSIYYTLFVSSALVLMVKGLENPRFFLPAAGMAGLAHLTRQDGIFTFVVLAVTILLARAPRRTRLIYLLLCAGIYALILSPLILKNLQELGVPFPRGSSQTMFLTTYEDFYVYGKELSLNQYLAQGLRPILKFKFETALYNLNVIYKSFGGVLTALAVGALIERGISPSLRAKWRAYLPPVLLFVFIYAFYTLIASYSSYGTGFRRSLMAVLPFLVVIGVDFAFRRVRWKPLVLAAALILAVTFAVESDDSARGMVIGNNGIGAELVPLRPLLLADAAQQGLPPQEIVLMAREAWEVYEVIRLSTIQIPNNDLDTILQVGSQYNANYILLPAKREALEAIYEGESVDPRFSLVGPVANTGLKLFRILK